jgi:hypothetical protein
MDENPMNHTCFPCNMPNKSPPSFHSSILPQTHDLLLAISHVLQDPHGLSLTVYTWLSDCHLHREALGIVESINMPVINHGIYSTAALECPLFEVPSVT